jgi:ABC-type polysaccharide/polyol phosphate transport system ATPase subunit
MARIELEGVNLTFRIRQEGRRFLKELLVRQLFRRGPGGEAIVVRALEDVSLTVGEGERLGVVGRNGAGKSTLLRLLAGVYPPTRGRCAVEGEVSSLFDINLGFEQDATGWDNIAFRAYLQGETPRTLQPKLQAIADFSELGRFLDMPLRYYSAGMKLRLAFSIATAVDPEILLVDEVLAVGDLAFQAKARRRIEEMMARARLMVLVSHDLESIQQLCTRALWLDDGQARLLGPCADVVRAYREAAGSPAPLAA